MKSDFHHFVIGVPEDDISRFIRSLRFDIHGFGYYLQQDAGCVPAFHVNDLEWLYCTQGSSLIRCDEQYDELAPGDLVLLEPGRTYSAQCTGEEPLFYYYIHFNVRPDYLEETYVRRIFGGFPERRIRAGTLPDYRVPFSLLLQDRLRGEAGIFSLTDALLIQLSVHLLRRAWHLQSAQEDASFLAVPRTESLRICAQAVELIGAQMDGSLRLEDLCAQLGVSESYLYKLFMRVFHQSPSQYIMGERLKRACHLLSEQGATVAAAAEQLGFSSPGHLSRQFKKAYGVTPSQWLQSRK